VFGGEAVVISPVENIVRLFNPVGSRIWELADGSRGLDEIACALTEEYDVTFADARRSVASFVDELARKGLLAWR